MTAEPANNQFPWQTMTAYRLAMIRSGTNGAGVPPGTSYACSMTDLNAGTVKAVTGTTPSVPAVSEVALIASGTTVHVAWVLVVSSP